MAQHSDLRDGDIVTNPEWNNGRPVRITRVGNTIRWQDVNCRGHAHQLRSSDDITVNARRGGR